MKKRKIAGAGLDVYENMPRLSPGLAKLDNVVLLPHMGVSTVDTRDQMARVAAKDAALMLRGKKPLHLVNPKVMGSAAYLARVKRGTGKMSSG